MARKDLIERISEGISLENLESSIAGFVSENGEVHISKIREHIFNYLKQNHPQKTIQFIYEYSSIVQNWYDESADEARQKLDELLMHYTNLLAKRAKEANLEDLEVKRFIYWFSAGGQTPFRKYCKHIIEDMQHKGLLAHSENKGYFTNPSSSK